MANSMPFQNKEFSIPFNNVNIHLDEFIKDEEINNSKNHEIKGYNIDLK